MWPSLGIAVAAVAGGTLTTYLHDEASGLGWRLCAGASAGFAAFGLIAFGLACFLGLTPISISLATAAVASPSILLWRRGIREQLRADISASVGNVRLATTPVRVTARWALGWLLVALVFVTILDRVMFECAEGIYTGLPNNLGDLPFHIGVVTRFAWGQNYPPEHPSYAGVPFTYPFVFDFIAAVFVRTGASLRSAFALENLVLGVSLIGLLYRWSLELTGDRLAAIITPILILLSGGLGWVTLATDFAQPASSFFQVLSRLPHDYTIQGGTDWRWGNMVTALLLPQRSLMLGVPLAIVTLTLIFRDVPDESASGKSARADRSSRAPRRGLVAAGILAAMLPLVHAHTFAVVVGMAGCLAVFHGRLLSWVPFFVISMLAGVVQILWISSGSPVTGVGFLNWHLGWDRGNQNILWFWFKNTGFAIPLIALAMFWRGPNPPVPRRMLLLYLPFTLCFLVPNVVKLAPWIWDNIKILIYWYIASAPLIALVLVRLWRQRGAVSIVAILLTISLTLSGALDIWRVMVRTTELQIFPREGITFAELVRGSVPPTSIIVHAPTYNHPVILAGRRSLMGYPGHVWSHGISYVEREDQIRRIYAGAADADALLKRLRAEYLVLGPLERAGLNVNDQFLARYPKLLESGEYALLSVATRPR